MTKSLYETDFNLWLVNTAQALHHRDVDNLDWDNLIEEIETLGRSEKKSVKSNLRIVLLHLLKYKYQPEKRSSSWTNSISEHRQRLLEDFEDSPSLRNYCSEIFNSAYAKAKNQAANETGLALNSFPKQCPFTIEQVLDSAFLPENI